jgi:hypothetical protein
MNTEEKKQEKIKAEVMADYLVFETIRRAIEDTPDYFKEIVILHQSRTRNFKHLGYMILPYFTEDTELWNYANNKVKECLV